MSRYWEPSPDRRRITSDGAPPAGTSPSGPARVVPLSTRTYINGQPVYEVHYPDRTRRSTGNERVSTSTASATASAQPKTKVVYVAANSASASRPATHDRVNSIDTSRPIRPSDYIRSAASAGGASASASASNTATSRFSDATLKQRASLRPPSYYLLNDRNTKRASDNLDLDRARRRSFNEFDDVSDVSYARDTNREPRSAPIGRNMRADEDLLRPMSAAQVRKSPVPLDDRERDVDRPRRMQQDIGLERGGTTNAREPVAYGKYVDTRPVRAPSPRRVYVDSGPPRTVDTLQARSRDSAYDYREPAVRPRYDDYEPTQRAYSDRRYPERVPRPSYPPRGHDPREDYVERDRRDTDYAQDYRRSSYDERDYRHSREQEKRHGNRYSDQDREDRRSRDDRERDSWRDREGSHEKARSKERHRDKSKDSRPPVKEKHSSSDLLKKLIPVGAALATGAAISGEDIIKELLGGGKDKNEEKEKIKSKNRDRHGSSEQERESKRDKRDARDSERERDGRRDTNRDRDREDHHSQSESDARSGRRKHRKDLDADRGEQSDRDKNNADRGERASRRSSRTREPRLPEQGPAGSEDGTEIADPREVDEDYQRRLQQALRESTKDMPGARDHVENLIPRPDLDRMPSEDMRVPAAVKSPSQSQAYQAASVSDDQPDPQSSSILEDSETDKRRQPRVRIVEPGEEMPASKVKGILKQPKEKFPEDPNFVREGVAPLKDQVSCKL